MLRFLGTSRPFATTTESSRKRGRFLTRAKAHPAGDSQSGSSSSPSPLPWGSLARPDFGRIRKATDLTAPQVDKLIREYLPEEKVEVCKQRRKIVKSLHRAMKQKDGSRLESQLAELRGGIVPIDEVMFVSMVFGHLQLRNGLPQAVSVVDEMMRAEHIHPSLKHMVSGFIDSLRTLEQFDAFPNRTALLKSFLPFMELATEVRKLRILGFRVAMSDRIKRGEILLPTESSPEDEDDFASFSDDEDLDLNNQWPPSTP